MTEHQLGFLFLVFVGAPGLILTLVLIKLQWDQAVKEDRAEKVAKEVEKAASKFPGVF